MGMTFAISGAASLPGRRSALQMCSVPALFTSVQAGRSRVPTHTHTHSAGFVPAAGRVLGGSGVSGRGRWSFDRHWGKVSLHRATSPVPELHVCLFVFSPTPPLRTTSLFFWDHLRHFVYWTFQHLEGIEACGCGLFQLATLWGLVPTEWGKFWFSWTCEFFVFMKMIKNTASFLSACLQKTHWASWRFGAGGGLSNDQLTQILPSLELQKAVCVHWKCKPIKPTEWKAAQLGHQKQKTNRKYIYIYIEGITLLVSEPTQWLAAVVEIACRSFWGVGEITTAPAELLSFPARSKIK